MSVWLWNVLFFNSWMFFRLVVEIEEKSKIVLASRAENLIGNVFVIREANRRQLNSPGC